MNSETAVRTLPRVAILNAGEQTDYLYGLVSGLAGVGDLQIEVVDSDNSIGLFDRFPSVRFVNLRGSQRPSDPFLSKLFRIPRYYLRLLRFALSSDAQVFHIQWENSLLVFDRTLLNLYYKWCGKKLVSTAHNVYREERDERGSALREWSLRRLYRIVDRIVVHTDAMKKELCERFGVAPEKVHVIPHGLNVRVPHTGLSQAEARRRLQIPANAKVVLFFGYIDRYKGTDILVQAVGRLLKEDESYFLLVAGQPKRRNGYLEQLQKEIQLSAADKHARLDLKFIPADKVESYFAAADCLALPYRRVSQSGLIFLAYRFGLPIVATDVGSFRSDIRDGDTGIIAAENTPDGFASALQRFFGSRLVVNAEETRKRIRTWAEERYSWTRIAQQTMEVYREANEEKKKAEAPGERKRKSEEEP